ncbi:MAG TPA: peptidylprolyl isomerase [Rhizomicrobium sp.]|jgi:cyclophilin family peptidyl-prolyl cis-trans isomerase|nr:peptidylprolyl isomerase [Rhizomicrobium sp.]
MRIAALALAFALFSATAMAADVPAGPKVLIETSMGDITLQLDPVHAPLTTANFLRYVKEAHFDGTVIYRVVAGFVIQAGSWDADIQPRPVHDPIPLEANNGLSNVRGSVAMARAADPASATAEFFVNLADNSALDHQANDPGNNTGYAVFAHVVDGMDVIDKIAAVPVGDNGPMKGAAPVEPIVITKVSLLPDAAP